MKESSSGLPPRPEASGRKLQKIQNLQSIQRVPVSVAGAFTLLGVNENIELSLNINSRALVEQAKQWLHFLGVLADSGATVVLLLLFYNELIHFYRLLGATLNREAEQNRNRKSPSLCK